MTKFEAIKELLKKYEDGLDSAMDALDILEDMQQVMNDPAYTEELHINSPAGELYAYVSPDKDNPSVGIYMIPKDSDGTLIDLAYAEVKGKELADIDKTGYEDVSLYTYADPYAEDFTAKNIIKRDDVVSALEIKNPDTIQSDKKKTDIERE